jgi:hypothetical protein
VPQQNPVSDIGVMKLLGIAGDAKPSTAISPDELARQRQVFAPLGATAVAGSYGSSI